jgi:hypothetical protein
LAHMVTIKQELKDRRPPLVQLPLPLVDIIHSVTTENKILGSHS